MSFDDNWEEEKKIMENHGFEGGRRMGELECKDNI